MGPPRQLSSLSKLYSTIACFAQQHPSLIQQLSAKSTCTGSMYYHWNFQGYTLHLPSRHLYVHKLALPYSCSASMCLKVSVVSLLVCVLPLYRRHTTFVRQIELTSQVIAELRRFSTANFATKLSFPRVIACFQFLHIQVGHLQLIEVATHLTTFTYGY